MNFASARHRCGAIATFAALCSAGSGSLAFAADPAQPSNGLEEIVGKDTEGDEVDIAVTVLQNTATTFSNSGHYVRLSLRLEGCR